MEAVDSVSGETVKTFETSPSKRTPCTYGCASSIECYQLDHIHEKKVTPPEEASSWLPKVHIVIGNLKKFLNGTYHGVSHKYLQEYLDEFCYRFNRRYWEFELPFRLLNASVSHALLEGAKGHSDHDQQNSDLSIISICSSFESLVK